MNIFFRTFTWIKVSKLQLCSYDWHVLTLNQGPWYIILFYLFVLFYQLQTVARFEWRCCNFIGRWRNGKSKFFERSGEPWSRTSGEPLEKAFPVQIKFSRSDYSHISYCLQSYFNKSMSWWFGTPSTEFLPISDHSITGEMHLHYKVHMIGFFFFWKMTKIQLSHRIVIMNPLKM